IYGIVEFGDDIAQRTAGMAEWYPAVHASSRLLVQFVIGVGVYEFTICFFTVGDSLLLRKHTLELLKSRWFSHVVYNVYASTNVDRSTFLYSLGNTLMKQAFSVFQFFNIAAARLLPVRWMCRLSNAMIAVSSSASSGSRSTISVLQFSLNVLSMS